MKIREIKRRLNGAQQVFFCDLIYKDAEAMIIRYQHTVDPYAAVAWISEGYYWPGRNYLIYKMFDQYGALAGHRFDVCKDVRFGPDSVEFTDLYLDAFVPPAGDLQVLDEEEVAQAVFSGEVGPEDQAIIAATRALLEAEHAAIIQEAASVRQRVRTETARHL